MVLPYSGDIGMSGINVGLGNAYNAQISLNDAAVRTLGGYNSLSSGTAITMNQFHGKELNVMMLKHFENSDADARTNYENTTYSRGGNGFITNPKKFGSYSLWLGGSIISPPYGYSGAYSQVTPNRTDLSSITGDFTIEGWFYTNSNALSQSPVDWYNSRHITYTDQGATRADASFRIRYWTAGAQGAGWYWEYYNNNGTNVSFPADIKATLNAFNHLALVRYNGTVKGYVNGTLVGSGYGYSGAVNLDNVWLGWNGDNNTAWSEHFTGYVDEVRISTKAQYTADFSVATSAFA